MDELTIRAVQTGDLEGLVALLLAVVGAGASVGFLAPLDAARARAFWTDQIQGHLAGERVVLVAVDGSGRVVGTGQLSMALPDNQPHRGDVAKMQVHPEARRQGIGRRLLAAVEDEARRHGRTVLVLDTVTGSPAEAMYAAAGWVWVGVIPDYALWPDGRPCDSTFFYKRLG